MDNLNPIDKTTDLADDALETVSFDSLGFESSELEKQPDLYSTPLKGGELDQIPTNSKSIYQDLIAAMPGLDGSQTPPLAPATGNNDVKNIPPAKLNDSSVPKYSEDLVKQKFICWAYLC